MHTTHCMLDGSKLSSEINYSFAALFSDFVNPELKRDLIIGLCKLIPQYEFLISLFYHGWEYPRVNFEDINALSTVSSIKSIICGLIDLCNRLISSTAGPSPISPRKYLLSLNPLKLHLLNSAFCQTGPSVDQLPENDHMMSNAVHARPIRGHRTTLVNLNNIPAL